MHRRRTNRPAFAGRQTGPDYVSHRLNLAWFSFALGVKDPYTEAHARRVAAYAGRLAISMNLTAEDVDNIWLAGLLHDIGKIALNEGIFRSTQAQLTKDMQAEVHRHPFVGISILKQFQIKAVQNQKVNSLRNRAFLNLCSASPPLILRLREGFLADQVILESQDQNQSNPDRTDHYRKPAKLVHR